MDPRILWRRALLVLLAYLALLLCWPLVRALYAPAFRAGAELVVGAIDPLPGPVRARFEPGAKGLIAVNVAHVDTTVRLEHQELGGGDAAFGASSFFHGYQPSAFLLALFLGATPLAWRVRRVRLAWALLLLHAFLALRCLVAVYHAYTRGTIDGRPVVELSRTSAQVLGWVWHFLWQDALAGYLVPFALWSLLVFAPGTREPARARA